MLATAAKILTGAAGAVVNTGATAVSATAQLGAQAAQTAASTAVDLSSGVIDVGLNNLTMPSKFGGQVSSHLLAAARVDASLIFQEFAHIQPINAFHQLIDSAASPARFIGEQIPGVDKAMQDLYRGGQGSGGGGNSNIAHAALAPQLAA